MSTPQLFMSFVIERLTASAVEIFRVFEQTVEKYEEEASGFKQEIEKLRGLLQEEQQKTDVSSPSVPTEEIPHESQHCEMESSLNGQLEDTGHIQEESSEQRAAQQQGAAEEDVEQLKSADALKPSQSLISEEDGTGSTNWNNEDEEREDEQVSSPLKSVSAPSPQTVVEGQNGNENDKLVDILQDCFSTSRESTHLHRINLRSCHCLLCSKSFSYRKHLVNHAIRMHSHDSSLLCALCGKTLGSTKSLNIHLQIHQKGKFCCICDEEHSTIAALTDHVAIHSGVKLHCCDECGKQLNGKLALKEHKKLHLEENQFRCSACGRGFSKLGYLFRHIKSHGGKWPHCCDICGESFLRPTHLKYHLSMHAKKSDTSQAT